MQHAAPPRRAALHAGAAAPARDEWAAAGEGRGRLPLLATVLAATTTHWQRVRIAGWSGARARVNELATGTAVWHHPGLPVVPLPWVLVRDPCHRFDPQALLSTDLALGAADVVGYFVRRW